jgi:hypothetical protein
MFLGANQVGLDKTLSKELYTKAERLGSEFLELNSAYGKERENLNEKFENMFKELMLEL